ncbi:MAG: hypothetical protein QX199_20040 [Methylococcaceae bacterium]
MSFACNGDIAKNHYQRLFIYCKYSKLQMLLKSEESSGNTVKIRLYKIKPNQQSIDYLEVIMATLTVHNLDDAMEKQLQISAKQHNCSKEEEVYRILKQALFPVENQKNLDSRLHRQILALTNGVELELPVRSLPRAAYLAVME